MINTGMTKLILIEDDPFLLDNIEFILEAEQFKVFSADCGRKGIKLIEEIIPDLIISDISLPDMEGYDILKQIRRNEELFNIPFIFLSARAEHKDVRLGMNLGADDYLTKPFIAKDLVEAIKTRLYLHNKRKEVVPPPPASLSLDDSLFIKTTKGIQSLKLQDTICIKALDEYTEVITCNKKFIAKKSLKEWEATLPGSYIRIHRSCIINSKYIRKIEPWSNYSLKIELDQYPESLISSRRYTSKLKETYFI